MALPSKTFQQLVSDMVAQWSAQLGFQPTLESGDALLALMQATAAQCIFLQAQIQVVNALTLASTRTGADLDAWMAQFNFTRLPAVAATGQVTFSAPSAVTSQVAIAPGVIVQTAGGAIQYQVVADTSQPTWNVAANAYILAIGQTSLNATVQALTVGSNANVTANQISQIATNLPGISTVTNAAAITNGINAETDTAFRNRFVGYINSLSKATYGAIVSAINGVQQGLDFSLQENINTGGSAHPGEFVVVIDDGSGSPPASLLTAVQNALEAVRGFTIMAETVAVTTVSATIALNVRLATGAVQATVNAAVAAAVELAVNSQQIGGPDGEGDLLYISQVEAAALSVSGVISVQPGQTKINGTAADLAGTSFQRAITTIGQITVGNY